MSESRQCGFAESAGQPLRLSNLATLYVEQYEHMIRYATHRVRTRADAEDVVHNVFLRTFKASPTKVNTSYLYVALRRECARLNSTQRKDGGEVRLHSLHEYDKAAAVNRWYSAQSAADVMMELNEVEQHLSGRCLAVFRLRQDGLRPAEIALRLGIAVRTVDAHWQRVRKLAVAEKERATSRERPQPHL